MSGDCIFETVIHGADCLGFHKNIAEQLSVGKFEYVCVYVCDSTQGNGQYRGN